MVVCPLTLTKSVGSRVLGFALLAPSVMSGYLAIKLYMMKPDAHEESIAAYKDLLNPLFPEVRTLPPLLLRNIRWA